MSCVLVIGIRGFVGQALAGTLLKQGATVIGLSRIFSGMMNVGEKNQVAVFNFSQFSELTVLDIDDVIWAGDSTPFNVECATADAFSDHYAKLICELLSVVLPSRLLYLSSVSVFDSSKEAVITCQTPPSPQSAYGLSKCVIENMVNTVCQKYGTRLLILRLSAVLGINAPMTFVPRACHALMSKAPVSIYGRDEMFNNVLPIDLISNIYRWFVGQSDEYYVCWNVGSSKALKLSSLVEVLASGLGISDFAIEETQLGRKPFLIDVGVIARRGLRVPSTSSVLLNYAKNFRLCWERH